jgi:ferredoxin--NADP+ reductase
MRASSKQRADRPVRVAIIGSGPAAFYAAEALLGQTQCPVAVDMFERLPTPYGLVRAGVAPDHQSIKAVSRRFERTAQRPGYRFFGNVTFGEHLLLSDLAQHYDQVLYGVGSAADRRLDIPGEDLAGCVHSSAFVGWYNGHPAYRDLAPDLSAERVLVVGNGNVAVDVARVLARTADELERTDIADHALERLRGSRVREIILAGRRGPLQGAFTPAELRELGRLEAADPVVSASELELDPVSASALSGASAQARRNLEILQEFSQRGAGGRGRTIRFRFLVSPVALEGNAEGRVEAVRLEHNALVRTDSGRVAARGTGQSERLAVQLVIPAIGYRAVALPGVPFDARQAVIPNREGRVLRAADSGVPLLAEYVVGWARTGPRGLIGSHKAGSEEVARRMIADAEALVGERRALAPPEAIAALLERRGAKPVAFSEWQLLDAEEVARGADRGAPRRKVVEVDQMLEVIEQKKRSDQVPEAIEQKKRSDQVPEAIEQKKRSDQVPEAIEQKKRRDG